MAIKEAFRVLEPDVTRDDFYRAAKNIGFAQLHIAQGDGRKLAYEEVWSVPNQTQAIHYLEDPVSGTHYVRVRARDTDKLLYELKQIPYFYPEELVDAALEADNHNDQVKCAFRLAVTFPQFDPIVFEILTTYASQQDDPLLRQATLNAIGYRCWPQFAELFERTSLTDPEEVVRETAQRLLPYIRKAANDDKSR